MKSIVNWVATILVIIGGLNWGLVGAFNFNFIGNVFGVMSIVPKVVYIVIAVAALWMVVELFISKKEDAAQTQTQAV